MTSDKDTAAHAMVIAEKKLKEKDFPEAKRFASIALNFNPELDGLSQLIEVIDVHIAYSKTVCGEVDWYGVLSVDPSTDDEFIGKKFSKLALSVHKATCAGEAFKIITEAWSILSDKAKRETYDRRLRQLKEAKGIPPMQTGTNGVHVYAGETSSTRYANSVSHTSRPKSFWTTCRSCKTYFEYEIIYLNGLLQCSKCREPFFAVALPTPPRKGMKSSKPISFLQHPPAHQNAASSVPSNLRDNFLPTVDTATTDLPGDGSTGDKKLNPGLTKNPSGPAASSSFLPSSGSSGDEKIQPGGINCRPGSSTASFGDPSDLSRSLQRNSLLAPKVGTSNGSQADRNFHARPIFRLGGARSTSGPVTSFYSASDGSQNFPRTFSTEHVKKPAHAASRPGGAGSAFSYFSAAYNMPSHSERFFSSAPTIASTSFSGSYSPSEGIQPSSFSILGGAKTSSTPAVSSFHAAPCVHKDYGRVLSSVPVPVMTGITVSSSVQSNGGEKIHASQLIQRESFKSASGSATSSFQPEYRLQQVLGNVKHDLSKTENKEAGNSRESMANRQENEYILLCKGRSGMSNKKASRSRDSQRGNQFTDKNNNLGSDRDLVHGSSKSKNDGNFSHLQLRSLLLQKAKNDINKMLTEWSEPAPSLPAPNTDLKKSDYTNTAGYDAKRVKKAKEKDGVLQNVQGCHPIQTSEVASSCENMDTKTTDYVTMDVPDPDFHDFDQQRIEKLFSEGQVWALYDDDDGMPRFYALINSVKSVHPFKIQISRLNSKITSTEIGPMEWITSGFTKTSGDFRIGKRVDSNALSSFSHIVKSKKGPKGVIQIFPGKGETWALYKNWSSSWNELTPEEEIHQYDIVLVLDDYNEQEGVLIAPLVKVPGFRCVFRQHDSRRVSIKREELFRFSHQVLSYTLTGEEAENAPKGYLELDPAAMPLALLQVIQEDGNSDRTRKSKDKYFFTYTYSRRRKKIHTLLPESEEEGQRP